MVLGVIVALALGLLIGLTVAKGPSDSEVQDMISDALSKNLASKNAEIENLNQQLSNLQNQIALFNNSTDSILGNYPIIIPQEGYKIDELAIGSTFSEVLSDKEITKLFDGKINFDLEEYDAEEIINLTNLEIAVNEEDFQETTYLKILKDQIEYKINFESDLNTSLINEEETLIFNLLGQRVEISSWGSNEVTMLFGEEYYFVEQESQIINGKNVVVYYILDGSVYLTVDGVAERIFEGNTETVNNLEIRVDEILYAPYSVNPSKVILVIGEDVKKEINSGDEYSNNSVWEWIIGPNSIGVVLKEDFEELNDYQGYDILGQEDILCLPEDFVCFEYKGLSQEKMETYNVELDGGLVVIEGRFEAGINDYHQIYINDSKFYDDNDLLNEITDSIYLGDSNLKLTIDNFSLYIDDINLSLALDDIFVDNINISSEDENYRNVYGIIINNPEDSIKDKFFKFIVSEEQLFATVEVF